MSDERTALAQVLWDATRAQDPDEFMPTLMTDVGSCLQVADVLLGAGYRKAEPVQIDREALIAVLDGLKEVEMGEDEDASELVADVVIAHLAAQPVTGTVEWGVKGEAVTPATSREDAQRTIERLAKGPRGFKLNRKLVRRTVSEWVEVN